MLHLADTAGNFRNKQCPPLADLVAAFGLTDSFPHLHPNTQSFTFFCRNAPGSRLDRAYIPPQLLPHLLAVTHLPYLSDHWALFQGCHVSTAARLEPHDFGQPFAPDFTHLPEFLQDIRVKDRVQSESMDMPVDLSELQQAIAAAASGKAPGLDRLQYEFYAPVLHLVGGSLVEVLNVMLERGALSASLQRGAVRLLPEVPGAPAASQLRPIT